AALADKVVATVGAGSDHFFIQANGWGPNGDWGAPDATVEAAFDQIWPKPVRRGEQAIQPQDYNWTTLYNYLYQNDANYSEVYLPSFNMASKALLASEIKKFSDTRCGAPAPGDTTAPAVPGGLTATPGNGQLTVAFNAVGAADLAGYDVRMKTSAATTWAAPVSTTATSQTFTGLANGTSYDVAVRSRDDLGNASAWSGTVSATPTFADTQPPTVPAGFTSTTTRTSIQVCWSASSDNVGVAGYWVSLNGSWMATSTATCRQIDNLSRGT